MLDTARVNSRTISLIHPVGLLFFQEAFLLLLYLI